MTYDLVIRNGTVVDGSGLAAEHADIGITDGTIAKIGRIRDRGREDIDAEGHVVTPGFIDGHTHMDAQVFWDPLGTSSCWHGVTSVIMGNCGFTLAPSRPDQRRLVVSNIERAEDISPSAMAEGINWTWETFAQYVDALDALPRGINYGPQVGHSALRVWAMGERAFEQAALEDDLEVMDRELRAALRAGAMGFTTSRSPNHETADDRPVASRLAAWSEVEALVSTLAELGAGVFQYANEAAVTSPDAEVRDEYLARLRALAVSSGVPFMSGVGPASDADRALRFLDSTSEAGGRMVGLGHSRGIAVTLSFKTTVPFDRLPEWQQLRSWPQDEQIRALRDPAVVERLVKAAHEGDYGRSIGAEVRAPDYDSILVMSAPIPPHKTVAALAAARGLDPVELMIALAVDSDFEQLFIQPIQHYEDKSLVTVMKHPRVIMTFSDSGAHVSQVIDSSIQTHLLAYWVREREAFTLPEAVRMLTLQPARVWGLSRRGLLREGMIADINVFDAARVSPDLPTVVADLPGGSRRLVQKATGFLATVVAGQVVLRDGEHTGALPGKLLLNPLVGAR